MQNFPKTSYSAIRGFTAKPNRGMMMIMLCTIFLLAALPACTPVPTVSDVSVQQTLVAAGVEATIRAAQIQQPPATTEAPSVDPSPTITPTPAPTESPWMEGSVVRASYDPAAGWGPPDVHDDFSGNNPEFQLDNVSGVAHGWYDNGRFNITFPTMGWWTWYSGMQSSAVNFYVDVVVYNGDQCVDRDAGGLVYRYFLDNDAGSLFGVTCGGGYFSGITGGLGASVGGVCQFIRYAPITIADVDCSGLWNHPTSEYIDAGPGAANRVGVLAKGEQVTLYINGHEVDKWIAPIGIIVHGSFALYLGAGQRDNASVSFDDLSIWFNP